MVRSIAITTVCALLLPALSSAATEKDTAVNILPFKATEKTLPNGLKVVVVPTGFPNIVSFYIAMQTGSRNEVEPGKSGFAHFFEHMMFRGTPTYSPDAYNAIITKAGARQNASTSDDWTMYYTTFAREDLPRILEIEADRFQNLSYSVEAFKTEANAVLGEYNKNSANPLNKLDEVQRESAFNEHTYKHTTMGFIKDIEDMPNQYEYSKTFFSRWYRPQYATIVVAGDVKAEQVLPLVEKYFGSWKRGTTEPVKVPQEPPAAGPVYAHVPWPTETLPWISIGFHGPSFLDMKEQAAMDVMFDVAFGETSDIYKRLVQDEQKVDRLLVDTGENFDPSLVRVFARLKKGKDAQYVRDEVMKTFAALKAKPLPADRVGEAKSNLRYSFLRALDNTDTIASRIARYTIFERSYDTLNRFYGQVAAITPADIQKSAGKYFTDANLTVATLSREPMAEQVSKLPSLASWNAAVSGSASASPIQFITQKSLLPNVMVKLLFTTGSANDPKGKEGLAALSAAMITAGGSQQMAIDEINKVLYPIAGSFNRQVDKDMTTFTGVIHRDNWKKFVDVALEQLLTPGFRDDDFQRLKDLQLNSLKQDLRSNNEEELGKEELQNVLFAGTPYGHTVLGTIAGLDSITIDDVKRFVAENYTRANVVVGLSGDYPPELEQRLKTDLANLPAGEGTPRTVAGLAPITPRHPEGLDVEIVKKETRATAISLGHPLPLTREDPDFAALNIARSWLGEHRASSGQLYNRIREIRGLNYGNYAYIESFNRPGFQFFPSPNIGRRSQLVEIWIRPVVPVNAQMAMRIALYELQQLIDKGLTQEQFENTRDYLMKNVYLMTANQNQRLGYALDSWWYGTPEYTESMRARYAKLTRDDVNRAIRKYLSAKNLQVVIVTKDAEDLRDQLVADGFSSIDYSEPKPQLADEDKVIGSYKMNIAPAKVRITTVEEVFAK